MMRGHLCWIGLCLIALVALVATPAAIAQATSAPPSGVLADAASCAASQPGAAASSAFLIPLGDLTLPAGVETLTLRLFNGVGEEILTEHYGLPAFEHTADSALEAWLGGFNGLEALDWESGDDLGAVAVEIRHQGKLLVRLDLDEAIAIDAKLRREGFDSVVATSLEVETFETVPAGSTGLAEGSSLFAKARFQCPNAHPFCDLMEARCEDDCFDAGPNVDPDCIEACTDDYLECIYGTTRIRTVTTYINKRLLEVVCGKKPCWRSRREFDHWFYDKRVKKYTGTFCDTTGRLHNERLTSNVLTRNKDCYKKLPISCSPFRQYVGCISSNDICPF